MRFVGVQRRNRFGHRTIAHNLPERFHHSLRTGKRGAARDIFFIYAKGGGEIAPQFGMRALRVLFFRQIFQDDVADRPFGAGGKDAKMFREGFHVAIILRGIKLQILRLSLPICQSW